MRKNQPRSQIKDLLSASGLRPSLESDPGRRLLGVDTREKTNREPQIRDLLSDSLRSLESARISQAFGLLPESDLLFLTLAIQLRCLARPFIGSGLATKSTTKPSSSGKITTLVTFAEYLALLCEPDFDSCRLSTHPPSSHPAF